MTQVSGVYGMENPVDLHLDNLSAADESDDENREDEIKKLLEEGLSNETFDCDSDTSSLNGEKFPNHTNCSFLSNKSNPFGIGSANNRSLGDGDKNCGSQESEAKIDLNMQPHVLLDSEENGLHHARSLTGTNGSSNFKEGTNGFTRHVNGDFANLAKQALSTVNGTSNKSNNLVQSNRDSEEINVTNPTISLLHKDHCPQNESEGLGSRIWLSAENNVDQLKTLCEFRERQIVRAEETVSILQKEKRALNHTIGIVKTEMIKVKANLEETNNYAQLKEEEISYLKTKLREAISEYEKARQGEVLAKQETAIIKSENEKLHQEIELLSSLGKSTQQAETSDVVRQLREKHAKDLAAWQKVVNELEGQVRTYKRTQQLLHEESFTLDKLTAETQTDSTVEQECERLEKELAAKEFLEEFGDCADGFIEELRSLPDREIIRRVRKEWKLEKTKLNEHYMNEIKVYQQKLATLPTELYRMWQKTQEELGLNKPAVIKPLCKSVGTVTEELAEVSYRDNFTEYETDPPKDIKEEGVQVNFAFVMANTNSESIQTENQDVASPGPGVSVTVNEKETSSVVVQTEETLETYKILAALIDSWAVEVTACKQRADEAEIKSVTTEEELSKLRKQFKHLKHTANSCRKEWKSQEAHLRKKNEETTSHYVGLLKTLNDKLGLRNH